MSPEPTPRRRVDDELAALIDYEHAVADVLALVGPPPASTSRTSYPRGADGHGVLVAHVAVRDGRWIVELHDEHPSRREVRAAYRLDDDLSGGTCGLVQHEAARLVLHEADDALTSAGYHRTSSWTDDTGCGLPLATVAPLPRIDTPAWATLVDVHPHDDGGGAVVVYEASGGKSATPGAPEVWISLEHVVTPDATTTPGPRITVGADHAAMTTVAARGLAAQLIAAAELVERTPVAGATERAAS